jgi:hypothetical protein
VSVYPCIRKLTTRSDRSATLSDSSSANNDVRAAAAPPAPASTSEGQPPGPPAAGGYCLRLPSLFRAARARSDAGRLNGGRLLSSNIGFILPVGPLWPAASSPGGSANDGAPGPGSRSSHLFELFGPGQGARSGEGAPPFVGALRFAADKVDLHDTAASTAARTPARVQAGRIEVASALPHARISTC